MESNPEGGMDTEIERSQNGEDGNEKRMSYSKIMEEKVSSV